MTAISFDDLISAQRAAVEANEAVKGVPYSAEGWKSWLDAAADFQAKVTEYATVEGKDRVSVEMEVKKVVRHAPVAEAVA